MYVYTYIYIYMIYLCICKCIHIYIYILAFIYIIIYTHMYIHVCIYIYIYVSWASPRSQDANHQASMITFLLAPENLKYSLHWTIGMMENTLGRYTLQKFNIPKMAIFKRSHLFQSIIMGPSMLAFGGVNSTRIFASFSSSKSREKNSSIHGPWRS